MKFLDFLNENTNKKLTKLTVKFTEATPGGTSFVYTIPEIGTDLTFRYTPSTNDPDFPEDVFNGRLKCEVLSRGRGSLLKELQTYLTKLLNANIDTKELDEKIKSSGICILSQYRKLLARKRSKPNGKGIHGPLTYFAKKDELLDKYNARVKDGYFDLPNWGNKIGHDKESQSAVEKLIRPVLEQFFIDNKKEIIEFINNKNLLDDLVQLKGIRTAKI